MTLLALVELLSKRFILHLFMLQPFLKWPNIKMALSSKVFCYIVKGAANKNIDAAAMHLFFYDKHWIIKSL